MGRRTNARQHIILAAATALAFDIATRHINGDRTAGGVFQAADLGRGRALIIEKVIDKKAHAGTRHRPELILAHGLHGGDRAARQQQQCGQPMPRGDAQHPLPPMQVSTRAVPRKASYRATANG